MGLKKRINAKLILAVLGAVVIITAIILFFMLIYTPKCKTEGCFKERFQSCERTSYTQEGWFYKIQGFDGKNCHVLVKAINPQEIDLETARVIKDKTMICIVPIEYTSIMIPHEKLNFCSGSLKETIQDIMIKRMYSYVISSLGNLSLSLS